VYLIRIVVVEVGRSRTRKLNDRINIGQYELKTSVSRNSICDEERQVPAGEKRNKDQLLEIMLAFQQ
jgi:hypothetical protein